MGSQKHIYSFSEGRSYMRDLLGGKGANICELFHLGIDTPAGFIITTETCKMFLKNSAQLPSELLGELDENLTRLEKTTGLKFGDPDKPLLVSVRSGAPISMPGMMDTLINIGLTPQIAQTIQKQLNKEDIGKRLLERLEIGFQKCGIDSVPTNPIEQLQLAIKAVFKSWNTDRAVQYRNERRIPHDMGTAVIIQMMVLGIGDDSGTGVYFTQDPVFGHNEPTGDWLMNAFGEELVSGENRQKPSKITALIDEYPDIYKQLIHIGKRLQTHFQYVQDIEYTIERQKVWILQCRKAILSLYAEAKVAYNMVVQDGDITRQEAIRRVDIGQLDNIRNFTIFPPEEIKKAIDNGKLLGVGLNPSFGAVTGHVALSQTTALEYLNDERQVIMVSDHADTEKLFRIMRQVNGILTQRGGATSHAALVARGLGKPCIVGCGAMSINHETREIYFGNQIIKEGDLISLDGWSGQVFLGSINIINAESDNIAIIKIEEWANEFSAPSVWASADYRYEPFTALNKGKIIKDHWLSSPYKSDKARSAYIRQIIPDEHNIVMESVNAFDEDAVRNAITRAIQNGFWAGVRTGLFPQPLGSSPWVMGLKSENDISEFMNNAYKEWINTSFTTGVKQQSIDGSEIEEFAQLTDLIIVSNPPKLGIKEYENEHFVFRLNCQNGIITLEVNLYTAQLRSIERDVSRSELIRIESKMDFREMGNFFYPHAKIAFGSKYFSESFIDELIKEIPYTQATISMYQAMTTLSPVEYVSYRLKNIFPNILDADRALLSQRCTDLTEAEDLSKNILEHMIDKKAYKVVSNITKHVFEYWWNSNVLDLPYMMWAFDIALGLHILEAQGKIKEDGEIEYVRIYDVRGREEKQEAERANKSSHH